MQKFNPEESEIKHANSLLPIIIKLYLLCSKRKGCCKYQGNSKLSPLPMPLSPSLCFYLIGLVTRGKKSFYLWSPTVTVAKIFVISRQDYCHRQNLELRMKIRLKFQAMNTTWLPVFSVTYAIVSLLGPCSHPSNFTLLKTWFPTFKIIKYVILTPKTMTFYITLILTLPSSMPSKIF